MIKCSGVISSATYLVIVVNNMTSVHLIVVTSNCNGAVTVKMGDELEVAK